MFLTCSTHNNPSHIDIASTLCPTAAMYKHHLTHPNSHEDNHDSECASSWMLEGVSEPTVVAGLAFNNDVIIKGTEVQVGKVGGTHRISMKIR